MQTAVRVYCHICVKIMCAYTEADKWIFKLLARPLFSLVIDKVMHKKTVLARTMKALVHGVCSGICQSLHTLYSPYLDLFRGLPCKEWSPKNKWDALFISTRRKFHPRSEKLPIFTNTNRVADTVGSRSTTTGKDFLLNPN